MGGEADLEGDAANGEVAAVLQHVEVLGHQGGAVHQAVGRLGVVAPLRVLAGHVLEPRQTQVRRVLVALGDPGGDGGGTARREEWCFCLHKMRHVV